MILDDSPRHKVTDPETNRATFQPEGWLRKIALKAQASTCPLPAAEARDKYYLSSFQHLALIGLFGMRHGDLRYDFNSSDDVTYLFARGRVCRKRMQEHLFGEKSQLMRHRLLEGTKGTFGEAVRLTSLGIRAVLGKQCYKRSAQDLKNRVRTATLFDFEEPTVGKEDLLLPTHIMEALQSLLFSESRQGK
jgi:hypothetical protein